MVRISREELAERWALTYAQDGYQVRANGVAGLEAARPLNGVTPDIEADKEQQHVVVRIIAAPETLDDEQVRRDLSTLEHASGPGGALHLIVTAECAHDIKERLDAWHIHADQVHIT